MILTCEREPVSIKTISKFLNLDLLSTIELIKNNKIGYFMAGEFKINITKQFKPKQQQQEETEHLSTKFIRYKYVYDGKNIYKNKTLEQIATMSGRTYSSISEKHRNQQGHFIANDL